MKGLMNPFFMKYREVRSPSEREERREGSEKCCAGRERDYENLKE